MKQKPNNPYPSRLTQRQLEELVDVASLCYSRGWCPGSAGNFSYRGRSAVWLSPSGVHKGALNPERFIPLDVSGHSLALAGGAPSLEAPVHLAIYQRFPRARCVVHAHPPSLERASANQQQLVFSDRELVKAFGLKDFDETLRIPVLANLRVPEMAKFSASLLEAVEQSKVPFVVLAGHGAYAFGENPWKALGYLEALEYLCRQ